MKKTSIESLQLLAKSNGGQLLSKTYIDSKKKLKWKCQFGHIWNATYPPMKKGVWCPKCGIQKNIDSRKKPIEFYQNYAAKRGGKCLSKLDRISTHEKIEFKCSRGHVWITDGFAISRNSWCHECGGSKKKTIDDMHALAKKKQGAFLSKKYVNAHHPHKWKCYLGHVWQMSASKIKRGQWCPTCSSGYGERYCRYLFEGFTGNDFSKVRPEWLRVDGEKLELDGYSEKLGVAFEHHGLYHYKHLPHFHRTRSLESRKKRDKEKLKICKENGVKVLVIPEVPTMTSHEDALELIKDFLEKSKVAVKLKFRPNLQKFHTTSRETELKDRYLKIVRKKKGKLIGPAPRRATDRIQIVCDKGHQWSPRTINLLKSWCPKCAGNFTLTLKDAKRLAKQKNGKCLSVEYKGNHQNLLWQCEREHRWEAQYSNVRMGTWCPRCWAQVRGQSRKLKTDDRVRDEIKRRGGHLIKIGTTKVTFRCSRKHLTTKNRVSLLQGTWCKKCHYIDFSERRSLSRLLKLREFVKACKGDVLSENGDRLNVRCQFGHEFVVGSRNVYKENWCKTCSRKESQARRSFSTIQKLHAHIDSKQGRLLTKTEVYTSSQRVRIQCKKGHSWTANIRNMVKAKSWCAMCYRESRK